MPTGFAQSQHQNVTGVGGARRADEVESDGKGRGRGRRRRARRRGARRLVDSVVSMVQALASVVQPSSK